MARRTVLITGASRGIGLAATKFMLEAGAQVVAIQRSSTPELAALASKYPSALRVVQGDATKGEDISLAIRETLAAFGSIDTVCFNAAVSMPFGAVATLPLEGWQHMFDVNLFGIVRFLREALPALRKSPVGGKVIFVSSAASEMGMNGVGAYSASKAALNSLNRTLAAEEPGLVCVSVHPGAVRTAMLYDLEEHGAAKGHVTAAAMEGVYGALLEPDVPGRSLARLALRAPSSLSGKYLYWNDEQVTSL